MPAQHLTNLSLIQLLLVLQEDSVGVLQLGTKDSWRQECDCCSRTVSGMRRAYSVTA